jgi:hypothetical protein
MLANVVFASKKLLHLELLELQQFLFLLVGESPDKEANHEVKWNSYKGIVSRTSQGLRPM